MAIRTGLKTPLCVPDVACQGVIDDVHINNIRDLGQFAFESGDTVINQVANMSHGNWAECLVGYSPKEDHIHLRWNPVLERVWNFENAGFDMFLLEVTGQFTTIPPNSGSSDDIQVTDIEVIYEDQSFTQSIIYQNDLASEGANNQFVATLVGSVPSGIPNPGETERHGLRVRVLSLNPGGGLAVNERMRPQNNYFNNGGVFSVMLKLFKTC